MVALGVQLHPSVEKWAVKNGLKWIWGACTSLQLFGRKADLATDVGPNSPRLTNFNIGGQA